MTSSIASASQTSTTTFPGISAEFVVERDWDTLPKVEEGWGSNPTGELCRALHLVSKTQGSFFKRFEVLGYRDGSVKFSVKFSAKNAEAAKKYFRDNQLFQNDNFGDHLDFSTKTNRQSTLEGKQRLYVILIKNNNIPEQADKMIRELVSIKNWHDTPLKPGQSIPPLHTCQLVGDILMNVSEQRD